MEWNNPANKSSRSPESAPGLSWMDMDDPGIDDASAMNSHGGAEKAF
jgi:hypothetical protein